MCSACVGGGDHADRAGEDAGVLANALGKRRLIAGADRNLRRRDVAARRAVDQVDAERLQLARELDRLLDVPAAVDPIGRGNAREQRQLLRATRCESPSATSRTSRVRFSNEPPYSSVPLIAQRRQELVQQIAMRGVDLDHAKAGGVRALRRGGKRRRSSPAMSCFDISRGCG